MNLFQTNKRQKRLLISTVHICYDSFKFGSGRQVIVLAFFSDDLSSNPAQVCKFYCFKVAWKNENKQNEAGYGPTLITRPILAQTMHQNMLQLGNTVRQL